MPISDPILPGPNNTFYLAGGFNGQKTSALSDVWELSLSGTLSSNMPNSTVGSWRPVTIGNLPGRIEQAGTIVGQQVVSAGGCDSNTPPSAVNSSCAQQDSFVTDVADESAVTPIFCAAPRAGPVLVPNQNSFSQSFASQVLLVLGTLDTTLWDDSNGLARGEVVCVVTLVMYLRLNSHPEIRLFWTLTLGHGQESFLPGIPTLRGSNNSHLLVKELPPSHLLKGLWAIRVVTSQIAS